MQPHAPYPLNLLRDALHRYRWPIRILLAIILVPCIFFWTYNRLTATPANPGTGSIWIPPQLPTLDYDAIIRLPPPDVDKTLQLATAITTLPALPATQPQPAAPEGMTWQEWNPNQPSHGMLDVDQVYCGPWLPDRRLQQMLFIEYLYDSTVRARLRTLLDLSAQPAALSHSSGLGYTGMSPFRQICRVLTARSRCQAEWGDHNAALTDLQTILHLSANLEDDGVYIPMLTSLACRDLAMHEMILQARTLPHSAEHRRKVIAWLESHPLDVAALFREAARNECKAHHDSLNRMFPPNERGRERLTIDPGALSSGLDQFLRIQNLIAWAYDDRPTHAGSIDALCQAEQDALGLPFAESSARITRLAYYTPPPTLAYTVNTLEGLPFVVARMQASYQITLATLAVLAYEADQGTYPDTLADLVPEYLQKVPNDPFVDQPLRYRLDDHCWFVVYSVGKNLRDDGGQYQLRSGEDIRHEDLQDYFFVKPRDGKWRSPPYDEWYLVPADAQDSEKSATTTSTE